MPIYHRYAVDPTGQNPDNLVSGEPYTLSDRELRFLVPKYGSFYTNSVALFDASNSRLLERGVDYEIPMICQEATLRYGQEIADAILITNAGVSQNVLLSRQVVGGQWQDNTSNIVAIYEAYVNDNRNVDWVTGVFGKPAQYPPAPHPVWMSDIYGFEPLTFVLERIANAISIGNTPNYQLLMDTIKNYVVSESEIDAMQNSDRFITFNRLRYALDKLHFNTFSMSPNGVSLKDGALQWFDVKGTNQKATEVYYWEIEHISTTSADFVLNSGMVTLYNGEGRFMLQLTRDSHREPDETFRIHLRRGGLQNAPVFTSHVMTIAAHLQRHTDRIIDAIRHLPPVTPLLSQTAKIRSVHRAYWGQKFS